MQKRRDLFWELFFLESLQSLATGRLATFHLACVDCELPNDMDSTLDNDGTVVPGFPAWKARFAYECIAPVAQNMQTAKAPRYSVIIELDRKVRDMEMPKYPQHALRATMAMNFRCSALLYIHRCFFVEAVSNFPANPMSSPFAPSFLAGYRNSCEYLGTLRSQFDLFPAETARFWALWAHGFSSAVMLSSVVTHATGKGTRSKVTSVALAELRRAVNLFERASAHGSRAGKFLPILQRLLQKAELAYKASKPAVTRTKDIFAPSTHNEPKDELSIFSGQTHRVSMRARIQPSSLQASSRYPTGTAMSDTNSSDPASSVGPSGPDIVDFSGLHPSLRGQWADFDVRLNSQILEAQREDFYPEPDVEMLVAEREVGIMATDGHRRQATVPEVPGVMRHPDLAARANPAIGSQRPRTWCGEGYGDTQTSHLEPAPLVQHFTDEHVHIQFGHHHPTASSQIQQFQTDVRQRPQSYHPALHHTTHPHQHQLESEFSLQHPQDYTAPTFSHHIPPSHDTQLGSSVGHLHLSEQHWDGSQYWDQQPHLLPTHHSSLTQPAPIDHTTGFAPHDLQETWQSFRIYVGSPRQSPF